MSEDDTVPPIGRSSIPSPSRPHRSYERPPADGDAGLRKERQELRRKRTIKELRRRPLPNWGYESLEGTCVSEWLMWTSEVVWGVWSWAMQMAGGMVGELVRVVVPAKADASKYPPMAFNPANPRASRLRKSIVEESGYDVSPPSDVILEMERTISPDHELLLEKKMSPDPCIPPIMKSGPRAVPLICSSSDPKHVESEGVGDASKTSTNSHKDSVVCSSADTSVVSCHVQPNSEGPQLPLSTGVHLNQKNLDCKSQSLQPSVLRLGDDVPFIDDGVDNKDESLRHNANQVLEAMRGFTSVQVEMMRAIQEAKQATTSMSKPKISHERCNSLSSITSGESLPSMSSLEKFLGSSRCTSTISSLPSSIMSSRNPSPSVSNMTPNRQSLLERTPSQTSLVQDEVPETSSKYDDQLERNIENCLVNICDSNNPSIISPEVAATSTAVQMREKSCNLPRPWSFDVSFLNQPVPHKKKVYAYTPQKLTNVETLINLTEGPPKATQMRPNTLKLKHSNSSDSSSREVASKLNDGDETLVPPAEEVLSMFASHVASDPPASRIGIESQTGFEKWLDEREHSGDGVLVASGVLISSESAPVTPLDIPIFLTRPDVHQQNQRRPPVACDLESLATSCEYESMEESFPGMDESFPGMDESLLMVKPVRESSSSNDGHTWHDVSPTTSDDNAAPRLPTPLSSPSSPVAELPSKIDITSLKGEIMALKKEIFARKGRVLPTSPDKSEKETFVSSVEDIGSLRCEISALKKDFLSLLDDNTKSCLKSANKKSKYKYAGKAMSIDSVDDIFKPKSPCLDRISSLDKKSLSDDEDGFFFSCKQTKWNFSDKFDSDSEQSSDVWYQSPNVQSSHGFVAKSKLDSYDLASRGLAAAGGLPLPSGGAAAAPAKSSIHIRQQVPCSAVMAPTIPTYERFCPATLRRLTEMLQTSSDTDEDRVSSDDSDHLDSSDDGFASDDDSDCEGVQLPCSVERVLYGLEASPFKLPEKRWAHDKT